ncbi:MAG: helix-turn-helix domain-containing protein [Hyphomicrobiaceae bacterium]
MTDIQTPRVRRILIAAAHACDISPFEVLGGGRPRHLVHVRQLAIYVAHRRYGWSLPHIGRAVRRDHSTVLHAVRAFEARMAEDPGLMALADWVTEASQKPAAVRPISASDDPLAPVALTTETPAAPTAKLAAQMLPMPLHKVVSEIVRYRSIGWSVSGIARRIAVDPDLVAEICGVSIVKKLTEART